MLISSRRRASNLEKITSAADAAYRGDGSAQSRRRSSAILWEALENRALLSSNLTITPTYDSSITKLSDAATIEKTIQTAINQLESLVTANSPVPVSIEFQAIDSGLGQSNCGQVDIPYSTYLADLEANPNKSASDITALATMPKGPNTGINGATQVLLTAANLDAIGDTTDAATALADNGGYNGIVGLNMSIINDSRPGKNPDNYDLQSTVAHEMDEVLGIGGNGSTLYQSGDTPPASLPSDVSGLDFFRYHASGVRSFTYNPDTSSYFSIDGGKTNLVYFNQQNGAGGSDFGDWGNPQGTGEGNVPTQVQDAFGAPGDTPDVEPNLGTNELTALDVIGYNLVPKTTTGGTITGTVFNDRNGNGAQDAGETGLANVKVYLDPKDLGHFVAGDAYTYTNSAGVYTFSNLPAGNYRVNTVPPTGFQQDLPFKQAEHRVTLAAGQSASGYNFGETASSRVSGLVYSAVGGKLLRLGGATITVTAASGKGPIFTTVSDSLGWYTFNGLPNTSYIVTVKLPSGYVLYSGTLSQTTPTLGSGQNDVNVNFTLTPSKK